MRHGADGCDAEFFGQINVAGTAHDIGCSFQQGADNVFLPCEGVAAARAEIGNQERRIIRILCSRNFFQLLRFGLQTALAFFDDGRRFQAAEIEFVDDGKNENLEEHRLYHRAFDADIQTALVIWADLDEAALELEKFEIIDKNRF